jgi:hypothetical protein
MYANAKVIPIQAVPEIRRGWVKESSGGGEFKYDTFDTL